MADKAAQLEAAAQGGKSGLDAYNKAIGDVSSMQQQALADAGNRAGVLNAPKAFLDSQQPIVSLPGQTTLPLLQTMRSTLGNYQGALNAAGAQRVGGIRSAQALLAQQAEKAQKGIDSKSYTDAISAYKNLVDTQALLTNGGVSPSEQRAAASYASKLQEDQDKKFAMKDQQQIVGTLFGSEDKGDQLALNTISAYGDLGSALASLSQSKDFKKLNPAEQNNLIVTVRRYFDPISWRDANVGPAGPMGIMGADGNPVG